MLVVLEGCDGTGKSTVAKNLAKVMNAEIIHCTTETPNDYDYFESIIKMSSYRNIIADRFMYGQFVYQTEEERHLTKEDLFELELKLKEAEGVVIHVVAPVETISDRLQERCEVTPIPISEIQDRFYEIFSRSSIEILELDTSEIPEIVRKKGDME